MLFSAFILAAAVVDMIRCSKGFLITRYEVGSQKISSPVRIVMLSDIHEREYGEGNSELLCAVRGLDPDIIVVVGDILSAEVEREELHIGVDLISSLSDIAPTYISYGNHETRFFMTHKPENTTVFRGLGALVLDSSFKDIEVNGNAIRIGGINNYCFNHYMKEKDYRATRAYRFLSLFCETDSFKLLLCHKPEDYVPQSRELEYEDWECDLVLSGHTHGGLVRLPLIGCVFLPGQGFFPKLDKGFKDVGNADMIIGAGLGDHRVALRINDPHELLVIELVPGE